ncbi:MAG: VOC family protein [Deltaproteobacteria bacterium]|nr:VOC family protein [Deltaproteobacteria bacterium]
MISRIDHVSIAVRDQKKAERFFREVLGAVAGAGMDDPKTRFFWQIFSLGDLSRLEIISPTGEGSFLDGFLKDREGGVHHITLQTPDLGRAMARLEAEGIPFFGHNEYPGGIWKEIFIHPRHAFGVLIQIAEFKASDWISEAVKLPAGTKWQVEKTEAGATLTVAHPGGGKVSLDLDREELVKLLEALERASA